MYKLHKKTCLNKDTVALVCVAEKRQCSPLTKTDGVHTLARKRLRESRMDTPVVRLMKDRGRGQDDRGPVKNETNETEFNTPRKN